MIMASMAFMISASAQSITRYLNVSDFDAVAVSGAMYVTITQGDMHSVAITGDRESIDKVAADIVWGKLSLSVTAKQKRQLIKVWITTPVLTCMEVSGAVQLSIVGNFSPQNFTCKLGGASQIDDLNITAFTTNIDIGGASTVRISGNLGECTLKVSGTSQANINASAATITANAGGASQIKLAGEVNRVIVSTSGASRVNAGGLSASSGSVSTSGASSATVNVRDHLRVSASGASSVSYTGNPQLETISISRSAKLKRKDN